MLPNSTNLPLYGLASKQAFKTIASRRSDSVQHKDDISGHGIDNISPDLEPETFKDDNLESTSSLPWYLQLDTPQHVTPPLSERQQLPELPPNPPRLLQPILEHMSIDLGLDDLALFDLRKLDPPTALGANLLMIIGTSRSERHLHVSADRFCRWLRNTHKLSPYADGLLGRGELKTKLRRKARRAKLLSSVGSSERGSVDDGLRTGWVCVNLGTIEDGDDAVESITLPEGFVGFGGQVKGTRLVIQMLTEEKREELDLEQLWGGALARYERKQARNSKIVEESEDDQEVGQISLGSDTQLPGKSFPVLSNHRTSLISGNHQRKTYHSNAKYCASDVSDKKDADYSRPNFPVVKREFQAKLESDSGSLGLDTQLPTEEDAEYEQGNEAKYQANSASEPKVLIAKGLEEHIDYLKNLPREDALKALGTGFKDFSSTQFLVSFFESFPLFPTSFDWGSRWALICYAIDIGHQNYTNQHLMMLFDEIRASGIKVPNHIYDKVLEVLLSRENCLPNDIFPYLRKVDEALQIIEEMAICSSPNLKKSRLIDLYCTLANIPVHELDPDSQIRLRQDAVPRLRYVLDRYGIDLVDLKTNLQLLESFADNNNWSGFWDHWRGFARRMQPKSKELYYLMFERLARTKRQIDCIDALRTWLPEIADEEPPVEFDEIAKPVMECLRVAEPDIERDSRNIQKQNNEWVKLWKRCNHTFLIDRM